MFSVAVLVALSGAGLRMGNGVVEAQKKGPPNVPPNMQPGGQPTVLPTLDRPRVIADPVRAHMDEERMKAMNDDRHKKLAADVDRLLSLTNELKSDVEKANKDELSVEVIRKAAEIEKLAHDVQSRMKN
jgi:hypothetical protein